MSCARPVLFAASSPTSTFEQSRHRLRVGEPEVQNKFWPLGFRTLEPEGALGGQGTGERNRGCNRLRSIRAKSDFAESSSLAEILGRRYREVRAVLRERSGNASVSRRTGGAAVGCCLRPLTCNGGASCFGIAVTPTRNPSQTPRRNGSNQAVRRQRTRPPRSDQIVRLAATGRRRLVSGWGTWIRTKTNRVRVCCATVTPFPNYQALSVVYAGNRLPRMRRTPTREGGCGSSTRSLPLLASRLLGGFLPRGASGSLPSLPVAARRWDQVD